MKNIFILVLLSCFLLCSNASALPIGSLADDVVKLVFRYGDEATKIVSRYGDEVGKAILKYGDDGIKLTSKYGDDAAHILSKYTDDGLKILQNYGRTGVSFVKTFGDDGMKLFRLHGKKIFDIQLQFGDDAVRACVKNSSYGMKIIKQTGKRGIKIASNLSRKNSLKFLRMAKQAKKTGKYSDYIKVVEKYLDKGIEVFQKHGTGILLTVSGGYLLTHSKKVEELASAVGNGSEKIGESIGKGAKKLVETSAEGLSSSYLGIILTALLSIFTVGYGINVWSNLRGSFGNNTQIKK